METQVLGCGQAELARAAEVIRAGGLVAFPTETVYGLGADALSAEAVARIFEAKERPRFDPIIVHVASPEEAEGLWREVPATARKLMEGFWPGPLTLVLPKSRAVPEIVTAGLPTLAVRMPDHPVALGLIRAAGRPIAAPSANRFGRPSPTHHEHVLDSLEGQIEAVLACGPTQVGIESTVISLVESPPRVLRPGGFLFVYESPNRLWPVDHHTTGLPLLPYLPPGLALTPIPTIGDLSGSFLSLVTFFSTERYRRWILGSDSLCFAV